MKIKKEDGMLRTFEDYPLEAEPFIEIVTSYGNGAKVNCPKRFLDKKVVVGVLKDVK